MNDIDEKAEELSNVIREWVDTKTLDLSEADAMQVGQEACESLALEFRNRRAECE